MRNEIDLELFKRINIILGQLVFINYKFKFLYVFQYLQVVYFCAEVIEKNPVKILSSIWFNTVCWISGLLVVNSTINFNNSIENFLRESFSQCIAINLTIGSKTWVTKPNHWWLKCDCDNRSSWKDCHFLLERFLRNTCAAALTSDPHTALSTITLSQWFLLFYPILCNVSSPYVTF